MTERGMIFNFEMVRAILEGRKTQTRLPVKIQPPEGYILSRQIDPPAKHYLQWVKTSEDKLNIIDRIEPQFKCPYGQIGDRIYVRETWAKPSSDVDWLPVLYKADSENGKISFGFDEDGESFNDKWKSPATMPKKYARIWLEITDIRVERVQDIDKQGADAEGMGFLYDYYSKNLGDFDESLTYVGLFNCLWNTLYKNWNKNPWVWVIEFKVITKDGEK